MEDLSQGRQDVCCKHHNSFCGTSGRRCHTYMAVLILRYRLKGVPLSVTRTVCMPFLPTKVVLPAAICPDEGTVCLRCPTSAKRKMTLHAKHLRTTTFVMRNVYKVEIVRMKVSPLSPPRCSQHAENMSKTCRKRLENVICGLAQEIGQRYDPHLASRKIPRALAPPEVVNLCANLSLCPGETQGILHEACERMQLAGDNGRGVTEICTTGRAVLSRTNVVRIVGTDSLPNAVQVLGKLVSNLDPDSPPLTHMAIMCACLPHSNNMNTFRNNLDCCLRVHSRMMSVELSETEKENSMIDVKISDWAAFLAGFADMCKQDLALFQDALQRVPDEETRLILMQTECTVKLTHFGNLKIQLTWKNQRPGQLRWTQESTAVVNVIATYILRFFELTT